MSLLLIDNYDSFTYNIVECLRTVGIPHVTVVPNDKISIPEAASYDKIIISPGPSLPKDSGNILPILRALAPSHSILGICLGHQAIAEVFGVRLKQLEMPLHGFRTQLHFLNDEKLYAEVPNFSQVGLYHSWTVDEEPFSEDLNITALSTEGNIMSIKHKEYDVRGVQFHPESYMTPMGSKILKNWLV